MNIKIVDIAISTKISFNVEPSQDLPEACSLESFLSEMHDNKDMIDLLENGEMVSFNSFLVTPGDNGIVQITSLSSESNVSFNLALDQLTDLCNICIDNYECKKSLNIDFIIDQASETSESSPTSLEFSGHAYMNINEASDFDDACMNEDVESALRSLQSYNSYNKLCERQDCFDSVSLPTHEPQPLISEPVNPPSIDHSQLFCAPVIFNTPAIFKTITVHDAEPTSDEDSSPPLANPPDTTDQVERVVEYPVTLDHSHEATIVHTADADALNDSRLSNQSEGDCDFMGSSSYGNTEVAENFIGILSENLVALGCTLGAAVYEDIEHRTLTNSTFSNIVKFKIADTPYKFESDTRYKRKIDAKRNVAKKACEELKFTKIGKQFNYKGRKKEFHLDSTKQPKSQLQEFFQKETPDLLPEYVTPHAEPGNFVSTVTVYYRDGTTKSFVSQPCWNKRAAETEAAKVALNYLIEETIT